MALTLTLLALPVLLWGLSVLGSSAAGGTAMTGVGLCLLYMGVWLAARPSRYELGEEGITMVFPIWRRTVPWSSVRGTRSFAGDAFGREVGRGVRVGSGGLFGSFGWLVTSIGTLEMYISRRSDLVLVECEGRKGLLVSPSDASGFAKAVQSHL
jgi:hypothetical protein